MRTALTVLVAPFLFYTDSPADSQRDAYVEELLQIGRSEQLHQDPYWHTLLHYKKGWRGLRSLVDDPDFFLAADGNRNPQAELEATIRAFFEEPETGERHPVCRFVLRFNWLKERLDLDESRLPVPRCRAFEDLVEQIQPESVTLIFPTGHMNSPASMYGHTLLTVETANKSKLLSYAVNYSALTKKTFGPFYIAKGLLGLYPGYFSILPYYAKLQEYSDVSDRDIWEYALGLDRGEIDRLLMHIYELEDIHSDYYFFNENCSYDLLFLLDAARPGLDLTDQCAWWVIPLDTIRAVKRAGLIDSVTFRPSRSTKIKRIANRLSPGGCRDALKIVNGELEPAAILDRKIDGGEKTGICDLASEFLQYKHARGEIEQDTYVERFLSTLGVRAALGDANEDRYSVPPPGRPDQGHHSNRFYLGAVLKEEQLHPELRLRPAYHHLLDRDQGYKRGSQIIFLDSALRYDSEAEALELRYLDLIDIVSIAPRDRLFKPISWKIRTGFFRKVLRNEREYLAYQLNPGLGVAYSGSISGLFYLMADLDLQVGGALDRGFATGAGGSCGILKNLTEDWKFHLYARGIHYDWAERSDRLTSGLEQNVALTPDMSLSATVEWSEAYDDSRWESNLGWNVFF